MASHFTESFRGRRTSPDTTLLVALFVALVVALVQAPALASASSPAEAQAAAQAEVSEPSTRQDPVEAVVETLARARRTGESMVAALKRGLGLASPGPKDGAAPMPPTALRAAEPRATATPPESTGPTTSVPPGAASQPAMTDPPSLQILTLAPPPELFAVAEPPMTVFSLEAAEQALAGFARVPEATRWEILKSDRDYSAVLARWSSAAGYRLVWDAAGDRPPVERDAVVPGVDFVGALRTLIEGLRMAGYPLQVLVYRDRVVRVISGDRA